MRRSAARASSPPRMHEAEHRAGQAHLARHELGGGVRREPGIVHSLDLGPLLEPEGQVEGVGAGAVHPHGQRPEAAHDEEAVEWTRHAPAAFWWKRSRSASSSDRVTMSPPTTSEWPPRYFVAEWSTRSAPSSSGRCRYGVAKVLSTTVIAPATAASRATALMSMTFMSGFDGVSIHTSRGGCSPEKTAATASRSVRSIGSVSTP